METDRLGSQEQVAAVASRLGHGLAELATDIRAVIESTIPALRDDNQDSLLEASIQQNIQTLLGILAHGIDPAEVDPPSAATEYARRLAQRGVSTFALIRAYRIGQAEFLRRLIEDLVRHGAGAESSEGRATLDMVQRVTDYVDKVVEALIVTYAQAREEWLNPNAILRTRVRSVLTENALDLDAAQSHLGPYRLRQYHLGLEIWMHETAAVGEPLTLLRRVTDDLAKAAGCHDPPLFVALDEASGCAWLPLATRSEVDRNLLVSTLAGNAGTYVGLGEPAESLPGFRRTHQQGLSATTVARVNDPPLARLTPYIDVAPVAMMCSDLAAARVWIAETLGPLAIDGERQAGFRETLGVFFATGGSYTATAKQLGLHRNTAQYRVRAAEEMRGRPLLDGHLDVELALLACHWLGPAVLQPAA